MAVFIMPEERMRGRIATEMRLPFLPTLINPKTNSVHKNTFVNEWCTLFDFW